MPNDQNPIDTREIRVFISSTFRDMMRERDLLVKGVFPELRRICEMRFVTFTEVDLRWGVTEEQAAEGKVLPLCLAEIERSRPYFIGLLGERYGWIPDAIPPEVLDNEPWLTEQLEERKSVTELEILHGVLNNPEMAGHAFFYFRDPEYVHSPDLSEADRQELIERDIPSDIETFGPDEAARRTAERKDKLAALKDRIRAGGLPLVDPYPDPKALADAIRAQFKELIDKLYPEEEIPDALERERQSHAAYARQKLFACIERPEHLAALEDFADLADHGGKGLVVTGPSGGGKTALLADWARKWRKQNPDDYLFEHYFGATPGSASVDDFLNRLLGEIKQRFEVADDLPSTAEARREALPLWLARIPSDIQTVLVLDGLNQIEGPDPDRGLAWLPRSVGAHVTILASALPGPALEALRGRGWHEHELPLATEGEIEAMVEAFLEQYRKNLEPQLRRSIVTAPGSRNPLFLRTVLEELRQFGSFERLPQRVAHYLEAQDPKELFLRVIRRWQEDFDGRDPQQDAPRMELTHRALTHLWAARRGLAETEWLELLGTAGAPLLRADWTPLFLALAPHLAQRRGLLAFGHDYLRQAVEESFSSTAPEQQAAHLALADYFEAQPDMTPRKADEWPWQLQEARDMAGLQIALTGHDLFLELSNKNRFEIWTYWQTILQDPRDMTKHYHEALEKWEQEIGMTKEFELLLNELSHLLYVSGSELQASHLVQKSYELAKRLYGEGDIRVAIRANNYGATLVSQQQYREAELLIRGAYVAFKDYFGCNHPDTWASRGSLAICRFRMGRLVEAESEMIICTDWFASHYGETDYRTINARMALGDLYEYTGNITQSILEFGRAHEALLILVGDSHPKTKYCIDKMEEIKSNLSDGGQVQMKSHSIHQLLQSAKVLHFDGKYQEALEEYEQIEDLCMHEGDKHGMAQCLFLCARLHSDANDPNKAKFYADMALPFAEDVDEDLAKRVSVFLDSL